MDARTQQHIARLVQSGSSITDYVDVLHLSPQNLEKMQELMTQALDDDAGAASRSAHRFAANCFGPALLEFTHSDGREARFVIYPIDISAGGMAFLHGAFTHPETAVRIHVAPLDGEALHLEGVIRHCRFFRGKAHFVGCQFNRPIPPDMLQRWVQGEKRTADAARAVAGGAVPRAPMPPLPPLGANPVLDNERVLQEAIKELQRLALQLGAEGEICTAIREVTQRLREGGYSASKKSGAGE
jgi:hypothetical protein